MRETVEEERSGHGAGSPPRPGVVVVLVAGSAGPVLSWSVLPLERKPLVIGRDASAGIVLDDDRASRQHAQVSREGARFQVLDLGSRNGTWINGARVGDAVSRAGPLVLRVGQTVILLLEDIAPLVGAPPPSAQGDLVAGPRLRLVLDDITRAARAGDSLLLGGETGTGKELAARHFHEAGASRAGPFVPVNCAAIPETLAESLLFGVRRGAFSGAAADSDGYIGAADGGTLFLDEIGELPWPLQAKVLRVLEGGEVTPVGATRPRPVSLRLCAATHRDLRAEVASGRFRADLFYRLGPRTVTLPALRERLEDLPSLVALAAGDRGPSVRPSFLEAACQRPWPGNVRELLKEVKAAVARALASGADGLSAEHLDERAGLGMGSGPTAVPVRVDDVTTDPAPAVDREALVGALARSGGNLSEAARLLRLHRTQLYRLLKKHGLR